MHRYAVRWTGNDSPRYSLSDSLSRENDDFFVPARPPAVVCAGRGLRSGKHNGGAGRRCRGAARVGGPGCGRGRERLPGGDRAGQRSRAFGRPDLRDAVLLALRDDRGGRLPGGRHRHRAPGHHGGAVPAVAGDDGDRFPGHEEDPYDDEQLHPRRRLAHRVLGPGHLAGADLRLVVRVGHGHLSGQHKLAHTGGAAGPDLRVRAGHQAARAARRARAHRLSRGAGAADRGSGQLRCQVLRLGPGVQQVRDHHGRDGHHPAVLAVHPGVQRRPVQRPVGAVLHDRGEGQPALRDARPDHRPGQQAPAGAVAEPAVLHPGHRDEPGVPAQRHPVGLHLIRPGPALDQRRGALLLQRLPAGRAGDRGARGYHRDRPAHRGRGVRPAGPTPKRVPAAGGLPAGDLLSRPRAGSRPLRRCTPGRSASPGGTTRPRCRCATGSRSRSPGRVAG